VTAAGGTITVLVGAVLLRLSTTGTYERYVRVGMGTWLTVAGVLVILLGFVTLTRAIARSRSAAGHDHEHDHDHEERVGVGWLLLAPIAALLLVAPPTLGAYGVGRGAVVNVREGAPVFDAIPRGSGPVEMSLLEYGQRSYDHGGTSFNRATVRLTGFVAGNEQGGGFRLARYQIACCAADATPIVVRVVGTAASLPARDEWVTVTGSFSTAGADMPVISATRVDAITAPNDPYD
jgi:uncharacterized repeat protein (TIGR03943 family)